MFATLTSSRLKGRKRLREPEDKPKDQNLVKKANYKNKKKHFNADNLHNVQLSTPDYVDDLRDEEEFEPFEQIIVPPTTDELEEVEDRSYTVPSPTYSVVEGESVIGNVLNLRQNSQRRTSI